MLLACPLGETNNESCRAPSMVTGCRRHTASGSDIIFRHDYGAKEGGYQSDSSKKEKACCWEAHMNPDCPQSNYLAKSQEGLRPCSLLP